MTNLHVGSGSARHVVVVDDDDALRALLTETLEAEGIEVTPFNDGAGLIDFINASARKIDLIVSDVRMEHMGGLIALGELRTLGERAPVLLMTAFPSPELISAATDLGAVGVMSKPIKIADLLRAVSVLTQTPRRRPPPG